MLSHRDCRRYLKVLTILFALIISNLSFPVGRAVKGFNLSKTVIVSLFCLISLTLYVRPITAIAGTIQLPQTGQDGDIQAGPSPRFTVSGDCVTGAVKIGSLRTDAFIKRSVGGYPQRPRMQGCRTAWHSPAINAGATTNIVT